jgi:acetoin utilization deacetylase AcuC-like enzyme
MAEEPAAPSPNQTDASEGEASATQLVPAPPRKMADPQRLIRIASVTREVLEEARRIKPEPGAVEHLRRVHDKICQELEDALPEELYKELDELTPDLRSGSLEELSLAHAEILGWLEGLFQGTQLAIQLQAMRPPHMHGPLGEAQEDSIPREKDPRYL